MEQTNIATHVLVENPDGSLLVGVEASYAAKMEHNVATIACLPAIGGNQVVATQMGSIQVEQALLTRAALIGRRHENQRRRSITFLLGFDIFLCVLQLLLQEKDDEEEVENDIPVLGVRIEIVAIFSNILTDVVGLLALHKRSFAWTHAFNLMQLVIIVLTATFLSLIGTVILRCIVTLFSVHMQFLLLRAARIQKRLRHNEYLMQEYQAALELRFGAELATAPPVEAANWRDLTLHNVII